MMLPEFTEGIKKLETAFRPLTDEERNLYWDRLKFLAATTFYKSIDYVIDIHKDKTFPKVAAILEATGQLDSVASPGLPEATGIVCRECNDIGYMLTDHKDKQVSVRPCECELGKKIREGWVSSFRRGKK